MTAPNYTCYPQALPNVQKAVATTAVLSLYIELLTGMRLPRCNVLVGTHHACAGTKCWGGQCVGHVEQHLVAVTVLTCVSGACRRN